MKYRYIIVEYKYEIGYLMNKAEFVQGLHNDVLSFDETVEDTYNYIIYELVYNQKPKTSGLNAIAKLKPILEYPIKPKGSILCAHLNACYTARGDYDIILIKTDEEIKDFAKLRRYYDYKCYDSMIINILNPYGEYDIDDEGDIENTAIDICLN